MVRSIFALSVVAAVLQGIIGGDEKCLTIGGICGPVKFCPEEDRLPVGLCQQQEKNDIECCQQKPVDPNDKTCGKRGGQCSFLDCGKSFEEESVCPLEGQKCCIWLQ